MEKRALIAFVLSMAVFIGWSLLFSPQKPTINEPTSENTEEKKDIIPTGESEVKNLGDTNNKQSSDGTFSGKTVSVSDAREIVVKNKLYTAVFTESGGRLKSLKLNNYLTTKDPSSGPKEMVNVKNDNELPLELKFKKRVGLDLKNGLFESDKDQIVIDKEGDSAVLNMVYSDAGGMVVKKKYTFTADSYIINLDVTIQNLSNETIDDSMLLTMSSMPISVKERYAGFGAVIDGNLLEVKVNDVVEEIENINKSMYKLSWAAYEDQYFLAGILPKDKDKTRLSAEGYGENGVTIDFINPPIVMPQNTEKSYSFDIYYGPKDYELLKSMDNELSRAIDFGWLNWLSKPLLIAMIWLYGFVGNYGTVIIIITIVIKIIFWPLTAKSYKSMKSMQKLQPQVMKLREKYKDDREAMNREMMQLYRTYKVNPLGGCLPMVIQIPVFIALYRLLDYALELRHAPFALWIQDLSAPDRLLNFGFNIPLMEPPAGIPVLTLLMGASMLLQQKMTPTPGDPTQAKIMMLMPVFFTFIFINFPSGLVLYWLVNNILSIGQQTLINKRAN